MFWNKEYKINLDIFFKLERKEYVYLKLISNTSVRNFKTNEIAAMVNKEYRDILSRFKRESKGFSYELPTKLSFIMDITKDNSDFYILVSKAFAKELSQKLTEVFGKITIEEVQCIKDIESNCTKYSLEYAKDDSLSLKVDRKDNSLLNANLGIMDILESNDRITVVYNFIPQSKWNLKAWSSYHQDMIEKYKNGNPLDKQLTTAKILTMTCKILFYTIDTVIASIQSCFYKKAKQEDTFKRVIPVEELSYATRKKETATIVDTQIIIYSQSQDKNREEDNMRSYVNSYNNISEDNKLVARKITKVNNVKKIKTEVDKNNTNEIAATENGCNKTKVIKSRKIQKQVNNNTKEVIDLEVYNFNVGVNKMSCEELSNFISLPGKELIEEYNLQAVKHNETNIPQELQGGTIRYGTNTYRGADVEVTTSTNDDAACMPVVVMAKMGGGKSSLFENNGVDAVNNGEGLINIDFIKNCETSDNIIRNIDEDKVVVINFADYMCKEGFGFNEINMIRDMSNAMSRYECASLQTNQIVNFIDNLGDEPFSASMNRFLDAACTAVFIHEDKALRDVVKCLECYKTRDYYVKLLEEFALEMPEEYQELIYEDINSLNELNETKNNKVTGTKITKIDGILSRIFLLRRNPSLKFMYSRSTKNNINLVELMQEGKAIFFKLPQSKFSSPIVKNVMVSYLMSKVMVASEIRAEVYEGQKLRIVNLICDEVQQARGSFENIGNMAFQMRKFRVKLIISCHGFHTISPIRDVLIDAGATIMLLKGSSVKNFEVMQDEFNQFGFEKSDLVSLSHTDKYKALCLIATKAGRHGCIVELPSPVKNKIELAS